jgi:hypothetical protein
VRGNNAAQSARSRASVGLGMVFRRCRCCSRITESPVRSAPRGAPSCPLLGLSLLGVLCFVPGCASRHASTSAPRHSCWILQCPGNRDDRPRRIELHTLSMCPWTCTEAGADSIRTATRTTSRAKYLCTFFRDVRPIGRTDRKRQSAVRTYRLRRRSVEGLQVPEVGEARRGQDHTGPANWLKA